MSEQNRRSTAAYDRMMRKMLREITTVLGK